jgi:hypothetical protein
VQQQGVAQGHGGDRIGALQEHHRFAEGLLRADDFDHLLVTAGGTDQQLDLAEDHDVKAARDIALVKQIVAAVQALLAAAGTNLNQLFGCQRLE